MKNSMLDGIEKLTKLGLSGAALVYLAGFLVEFFHMSRYGVFHNELLKINYLVSGFLFLFPLVLIFILLNFCIYYGKVVFDLIHKNPPTKQDRFKVIAVLLGSALVALMVTFVAAYLIYELFIGVFRTDSNYTPLRFFEFYRFIWHNILYISTSFLFVFLVSILSYLTKKDVSESKAKKEYYGFMMQLILIFLLSISLFVQVNLFAQTIYPKIPYGLGGGEPIKIELIIERSSPLADLNELKIKDDNLSLIGNLILASNSQYVVSSLDSSKTAFIIEKNSVLAIKILKN
ncbi:hypothetical protein GYA19_01825 [Candidatus Beckwithbacteria bacterium]|nr:hypothetical protein [Candidatus Beckwithbacteria bacterium]